jgi:hypothetical protein
MANSLSNMFPDLYEALDIVSRELVGFIPAVTLDASAERAALNQTIRVPVTPASTGENTTPGSLPPDTGDQTVGNTTLSITKSRTFPFRWQGEEQKGMNTGVGYRSIKVQQIAQAMRAACNEVESDLAGLFNRASRAYGTAGTTPFATGVGDAAQVLKILKDNGAPEGDVHLIIDTNAGANMRSNTQLTKANEAGGDELLRQGVLLNLFGMQIRESAQIKQVTKGNGASYVLSANQAVKDTSIALITGTGNVNAGDIVTIAGDANKYVVGTGINAPGSIVLNSPGLRLAHSASDALTVGNSYTANMAFHRSAVILVARPPALPEEGDMATDREIITDPRSGLSFEVAVYPQYRRVRYELSLAWGVALIKPDHAAILLG